MGIMKYLEQAVADQASDLFLVAGSPACEKLEGRIRQTGEIKLFPDSLEAGILSKIIKLTPTEFEILYCLMQHVNQAVGYGTLLDEVWGFDYYGDSRTVDVHVKRLREKLENVSEQWSLKTVWGVGYKFEVK